MESAFPDSDAVERRLVVKGTDDLGLDGFAPGEHHLSIVKVPEVSWADHYKHSPERSEYKEKITWIYESEYNA